MAFTNKYEFETISYGTQGWNALLTTFMQKVDEYLNTRLRYQVDTGEAILEGDVLCIVNGKWRRSLGSDPDTLPPVAVAMEDGDPGEYVRGVRAGPITVTDWDWSVDAAGQVYLDGYGELVETPQEYRVGIIVNTTTILVDIDRTDYVTASTTTTEPPVTTTTTV